MSELDPVATVLMVADKIDVGPKRLSPAVRYMRKEDIENDPHIQANNQGRSEGIHFSEDGSEMTWRVVYIPPNKQVRPKSNTPEFDTWKNIFLGTSTERIATFGYASFAAFRGLEQVIVRLERYREDGEEDEVFETRLTPGTIDDKVQQFANRVPYYMRRKHQAEAPIGGK